MKVYKVEPVCRSLKYLESLLANYVIYVQWTFELEDSLDDVFIDILLMKIHTISGQMYSWHNPEGAKDRWANPGRKNRQ